MVPLDFAAWPGTAASLGAAMALAFVTGSMVGSFLNVVAHRVPCGRTVVFGRSHCPACGATIRSRDNVPVVGWLLLRGRCRDCGTRISARYPLVEAGCGCLAAVLAAAELAAFEPAAAVAAWAGHTAVALTLVAWALLAARGHAVSMPTVGMAVVAATLAAALVPALRPLTVWCPAPAWASTAEWPGCLIASLAGTMAGWLAGAAAGGPACAACTLVGAALGWQAAALAALAAYGSRPWLNVAAGPATAVLAVVCWHPLARAWGAMCRACNPG